MEKFIDIDKFVENCVEQEQNKRSAARNERRRVSRVKRKTVKRSAMTGMFIDVDEWKQWIVCSFKDEEMRFQVGPCGPVGGIQRRTMECGEWSDWIDAES